MTSAHLHAVEHLDRPIDEVVGLLRRDIATLAGAATREALDATAAERATFGDTSDPGSTPGSTTTAWPS